MRGEERDGNYGSSLDPLLPCACSSCAWGYARSMPGLVTPLAPSPCSPSPCRSESGSPFLPLARSLCSVSLAREVLGVGEGAGGAQSLPYLPSLPAAQSLAVSWSVTQPLYRGSRDVYAPGAAPPAFSLGADNPPRCAFGDLLLACLARNLEMRGKGPAPPAVLLLSARTASSESTNRNKRPDTNKSKSKRQSIG